MEGRFARERSPWLESGRARMEPFDLGDGSRAALLPSGEVTGVARRFADLVGAGRANQVMVVYNLTGAGKVEDMVDQSLAPRAGDFMIKGSGGADKFVNSNLDQGLKDRGIKTVIVTGTSGQGAVCGTTNGAAQRGYKAVVPVDAMSAEDAFNELYAAYHIAKGGPVNLTSNATLTRSDMIKFGE